MKDLTCLREGVSAAKSSEAGFLNTKLQGALDTRCNTTSLKLGQIDYSPLATVHGWDLNRA